ncbi:MAG: hypothetical protein SO112_01895 [Treponema sp.]|nr:hypothetical protein [Treponema sp.]
MIFIGTAEIYLKQTFFCRKNATAKPFSDCLFIFYATAPKGSVLKKTIYSTAFYNKEVNYLDEKKLEVMKMVADGEKLEEK